MRWLDALPQARESAIIGKVTWLGEIVDITDEDAFEGATELAAYESTAFQENSCASVILP